MAFVSWTAHLANLRDILADGDPLVDTAVWNGKTITWRSLDEFMRYFKWVEGQALAEQNSTEAPVRRVYVKNGGSGLR